MFTNSRPECIVFDLDGTLTMSHESIYKSTIKTLNEFNLPVNFSEKDFYKKIGWHFQDIFDDFNIPVKDMEEFIRVFKSNYFEFIDATKVYPGVDEMLKTIKETGIKTALLTTKAQDQAEKVVSYFNLAQYFDLIVGRRQGMDHKPSPQPLKFICDELNVDVKNTLMVGDSEMDIRCAKNAGAVSCGVTYGYRKYESLADEKPDFLINKFLELGDIINHN